MNKTSKLSDCSLISPALKAALIDFSKAYFYIWWEMKHLSTWRRTDLDIVCQSLICARNELDAAIKELTEAVDKVEPWTNAHKNN